jgi:UDPglucose 6-dehydrogenase
MSSNLPNLSVIGTGYLGATHAICMASAGFDVVAVDSDADKIASLAAGVLPFHEPDLPELLAEALASGRLRFTTDPAEAGRHADVHFVCVGTPQTKGSDAADLTHVRACVAALAPHLRSGALIVGKSTVPVGTAAELAALVAELAPEAGAEVAWNPEFLREGFAVEDTLRPDRMVFGVSSMRAERQLRAAFAPVLDTGLVPVIVTDLATAELVKVAANGFLATKISYINAMAELCELVDADVVALAESLSHDARIGGRFLRPGLGFGGGCLPKDIRAFRHRAEELGGGASLAFLREVDAINLRCRTRTVEMVRELVGDLNGARVAALGAAFKPNSDDIRDSPALDVAAMLRGEGAHVTVYDPQAMDNARRAHPELTYAESAIAAITDCDVVVLLTEWAEFQRLSPLLAASVARSRFIVDARHALDGSAWQAAGWRYRALGIPELEADDPALEELAS